MGAARREPRPPDETRKLKVDEPLDSFPVALLYTHLDRARPCSLTLTWIGNAVGAYRNVILPCVPLEAKSRRGGGRRWSGCLHTSHELAAPCPALLPSSNCWLPRPRSLCLSRWSSPRCWRRGRRPSFPFAWTGSGRSARLPRSTPRLTWADFSYRYTPRNSRKTPCDPIFIGAYEWGGKSGIGRDDFLFDSPGNPLNSKYGTRAGFGPATRPLNKILYPHAFRDNLSPNFNRIGALLDSQLPLDKLRCPADDGPPGGAHCPDWINNPGRSSFDHFGNSYAANIFMIWAGGGVLGPNFLPGEMGSNSPYLRPSSRIPAPYRVINYEENIGRWAWACRRERCDGSLNSLDLSPGVDPGPTKALRGWHDKDWTYNHGFADGHVERQRVYIEGTEDADGYAYHYRSELVFPDDPQRQSSSACVIVRGPGWQKDTLPAPYMRTGLIHARVGRPSYENCVTNP